MRRLPLAETYSIFFVAPLFITMLAVPILHEQVDSRRWVAVVVGFLGVLIILRPTGAGAVSIPGLAVLVAAAGYALSAITVRVLGRTDSTQSIVFRSVQARRGVVHRAVRVYGARVGAGLRLVFMEDRPPPITYVGAAVIIASGVYLMRRERTHLEAEHP